MSLGPPSAIRPISVRAVGRSVVVFYDLLRRWVPYGNIFIEIGEVRQMAADRRVVAEHFVLYRRLSAADRVEKVSLVVRDIVVTRRCGERLRFFIRLEIERRGEWIFFLPLLQIFVSQFRWPALNRVALRLRTRVPPLLRPRRNPDHHPFVRAV